MPSTYELFRIPVPPSEEDVIKYSQLRLLGLKTNPEAFGSTFEGESKNTHAQWKSRIDKEERFTIIARLVSRDSSETAREEWVGTASILTPTMWARSDADTYGVVGMWVHPEHRRKGLGKKLLEFGIEWVRTRTEGNPTATRLALEVHRGNEGAKKLYDGLAFVESRDELCEDPDRIPLFLVVK
ncbi:acyl-CoA N-acyltransferase [Mycena albidolilacea]|uniref:Acyl-CoA N-acyltransferase n=1 Tax=Mycena albidolilacea TaxID=1033008 RepID=A0AAD6ZWN5_9AGAR|nr:acyl-CoA N-acyltransferase [Mycena albidolilacea]